MWKYIVLYTLKKNKNSNKFVKNDGTNRISFPYLGNKEEQQRQKTVG